MLRPLPARAKLVLGIGVFTLATGATVRWITAADHRDSGVLAANPARDIADIYSFRSPANSANLVLVMTVSGLIPPAEASTTFFDPAVLYQWKIDTDGNAVEDLVVQAFATGTGPDQIMHFRGPVVPEAAGTTSRVPDGDQLVQVAVSSGDTPVTASAGGVTVFAGVRDDPFFFDLAQFNQIVAGNATGFNDPGIDTFAGTNVLALVVEVPIAQLGASSALGVWGTTSQFTD
ncbi:MAG TPA: DUF4331 family protein [Gemmatimonadales bacterium]|nr:DUF4331 family protein [Gemmatimonadales bacterium]